MPLATPAGPISKIAALLETMLGAVATWDTFGATLYHHHLPNPTDGVSHTAAELAALRPFVLVWTADRNGIAWHRETAGPGIPTVSDGELIIRIERNTPDDMTPAEAARDWENVIGQLCKGTAIAPGLIDLAADPRYLPLTSLTLVEHSRTVPEKVTDIGDAQRAFLLAEWATG